MRSSAGVIAVGWGKGADVGVSHRTVRKRAVGTRERITAYLAEAGELFDANGMASTQLAAAVGYPGSSVAFAQLLSGMERSGLIGREVRGKRTYRIGLGPARAARPGGAARATGRTAPVGAMAGASAGPSACPPTSWPACSAATRPRCTCGTSRAGWALRWQTRLRCPRPAPR